MIILGLTGSIGMGKSTTANMFREQNIPVHDADATVHKLYENEAVEPLRKLFPDEIKNDRVDRQALSAIVLDNPENLKQLQKLIHPMVRKKELGFLQKTSADEETLVVLDIPLLFETKSENRMDAILVVTASEAEQKKRVLSRPLMSEEKLNAILKHQMPDSEKRQKADFIIDTERGMKYARRRVADIITQLRTSDRPWATGK